MCMLKLLLKVLLCVSWRGVMEWILLLMTFVCNKWVLVLWMHSLPLLIPPHSRFWLEKSNTHTFCKTEMEGFIYTYCELHFSKGNTYSIPLAVTIKSISDIRMMVVKKTMCVCVCIVYVYIVCFFSCVCVCIKVCFRTREETSIWSDDIVVCMCVCAI